MNANTWCVILDPLSPLHSADQDASNNQDMKTSGPASTGANTAAKTTAKNIAGEICPELHEFS